MAMDFLTIPSMYFHFSNDLLTIIIVATSIDVKWTFSQGCLLLLHVQSWLSVQLTHALLCLRVWSLMEYVKDSDMNVAAILPEVVGEEEEHANDWDSL